MVYLRSLDDTIQIHVDEGQNLLVGRLLKCDVVLEDGSVSSQHARLHMENHLLRVVDMGSTNGTRINYTLIDQPSYLMDGDTVEFGNLTFTVDGPELQAPPPEEGMRALVDLEPLDASQELSDTMLSIPMPSEEELKEELEKAPGEEPGLAEESRQTEEETDEAEAADPVQAAFLLSLGLLLAGGLLLWIVLWLNPIGV